jgi:hypothetical protein
MIKKPRHPPKEMTRLSSGKLKSQDHSGLTLSSDGRALKKSPPGSHSGRWQIKAGQQNNVDFNKTRRREPAGNALHHILCKTACPREGWSVVSIERAEKKIREANFFLDKMNEQHARAFGDREPIWFLPQRVLSAANSVDDMLRHAMGLTKRPYEQWRGIWEASLPEAGRELHKFFAVDRNLEVHDSGSLRNAGVKYVPVHGEYSDRSGRLQEFVPVSTATAQLGTPRYFFTISGVEREANEALAAYLTLLSAKLEACRAKLKVR